MIPKNFCPKCKFKTAVRHCASPTCEWFECPVCPVAKGKVIFHPFDSRRSYKVR